MREDAGLLHGAEALWQKGLLYDYTLKVQDQEIRVHKFILASVSDYFRVMLCGSLSESRNDSVELKEVNAELMSDLIKFIYTGDNSIIINKLKEILDLAVYFQMTKVIEKCQEQLLREASIENCFDLLTTFEGFSLKEGVEEVTDFIQDNAYTVIRYYNLESTTPKALEIILGAMEWLLSDVHGVLYIIKWIDADYDKRKEYANHFLGRIKFHLLTSYEIMEIKETDEYVKINGTWKGPIEKAYAYHHLPGHQRILSQSEKSNIEGNKCLVGINSKQNSDGLSTFYVLHQIEDEVDSWKICTPLKTPQITGAVPFVIEVNNFLITCSEFGENQKWHLFDSTTLTWFKMANMSEPRDRFTMVQHDRHLYVLGGCIGSTSSTSLTDTVEEYSFDTGTWSSTKKLPVAVKNHSACTLNGCIYVSGGEIAKEEGSVLSARLDCLNVSTGIWESKSAMLRPTANHKMCVMMVEEKETIVVIDRDMRIQYYDPLCDQWSTCEFSVKKHNYEDFRDQDDTTTADCKNLKWGCTSRMFVEGNSVYFLNLTGLELDHYENKDDSKYVLIDSICVKWVVAEEKKDEINQFTLPAFNTSYIQEETPSNIYLVPQSNVIFATPPKNFIFGLLAFPPEVLKYKKSSHWS